MTRQGLPTATTLAGKSLAIRYVRRKVEPLLSHPRLECLDMIHLTVPSASPIALATSPELRNVCAQVAAVPQTLTGPPDSLLLAKLATDALENAFRRQGSSPSVWGERRSAICRPKNFSQSCCTVRFDPLPVPSLSKRPHASKSSDCHQVQIPRLAGPIAKLTPNKLPHSILIQSEIRNSPISIMQKFI